MRLRSKVAIVSVISERSPQRLNKESNTAVIQKLFGIDNMIEHTKKAARIPIPPPFGITVLCELRRFGLSKSDSLNPHLAIIHAPAPPSKNDIK